MEIENELLELVILFLGDVAILLHEERQLI
jgi:hypothetical protein